ncbi:MAG: hypothetical protein J0I80_11620 [Sphingomonas sp.]|nr:hypothetical protein [Sphingomonas sp.]
MGIIGRRRAPAKDENGTGHHFDTLEVSQIAKYAVALGLGSYFPTNCVEAADTLRAFFHQHGLTLSEVIMRGLGSLSSNPAKKGVASLDPVLPCPVCSPSSVELAHQRLARNLLVEHHAAAAERLTPWEMFTKKEVEFLDFAAKAQRLTPRTVGRLHRLRRSVNWRRASAGQC